MGDCPPPPPDRRICDVPVWGKRIVQMSVTLACSTGYIRPIVEYAVPVWHSGLTKKQTAQIERIQKRALSIILGTQYFSYHHALQITKLQSLHERRRELCLRFAKSLQCSAEFRDWLPPPRISRYTNSLRNVQTHRAIKCRTERYKGSPIPYLVDLMNNV